MIARPARGRIRSRKPWVLDRRRLFGWNVRLLTRYSHYTTSTVRTHRWTGTREGTGANPDRPAQGRGNGPERPQTPTSITEDGRRPANRSDPDRPWSTPQARRPRGLAAAGRPRRAQRCRGIVAGLWMRLLASPSLRVGRQGHDAR